MDQTGVGIFLTTTPRERENKRDLREASLKSRVEIEGEEQLIVNVL